MTAECLLLCHTGKAQANLTGVRLKKMGVVFSRLVHSSMARARETSQLIRVHLSQVSVEEDSLLIEGGPTQPDPTVSYWSLPNKVSLQLPQTHTHKTLFYVDIFL